MLERAINSGYTFFQRIVQPRIPQDPIEGALKFLLYSQAITMPMTLNNPPSLENSTEINAIHASAATAGFIVGLGEYLLRAVLGEGEEEQPDQPVAAPAQRPH